MNRRTLMLGAVAALAAPPGAAALQSPRPSRIGVLAVEDSVVLRGSLRDLGYVEGRNVTLEIRTTRQTPERIDDLAQELVRLPVDIIVATHPAAVFSARRATATIPIVMVHTPDPVELGLVKSLARPGGNITGVTSLSVDVSVKQLQILREVVPMAARVAMLWNPDNPWHPLVVKGLRERPLGVQIRMVEVRGAGDLEKAFETVVRGGAGAVLALADPMMFSHRRVLAHLAVRHRLPLMGGLRAYTQAGALMSYWADEQELVRRAATYVDRILKGAHPGALPIEQPSKYDLIVNVTTARALGLTIPPSLLLQADEVIE